MNIYRFAIVLFLSLFSINCQGQVEPPNGKYNVLFIMVDDLRPQLGTYGHQEIKSPNIDKLASQGFKFNNAFCNVPVCGASRASLLTGVRPNWPKRFNNFLTYAEKDYPSAVTLPEYFKQNGYYTISNGKIFHHKDDSEDSWSEKPWKPVQSNQIGAENSMWQNKDSKNYINKETGRGPYFEYADVPDDAYFDGKVAEKSIQDLRKLSKMDQPFFLAVGFVKPHLPFNSPKKYWDMYSDVKIADNRFHPENLPEPCTNSREIFSYGRVDHYNTLEFHQEARHAYYACVSYIDAQVGKVLEELKNLGLEENTIVVLLGDHGWHLGEHNFWGKHNALYNALHVPMIMKVPGNNGREINNLVEFVDIYPTLCKLNNLNLPSQLHGSSMVPLFNNQTKNWKDRVYTEWQGARTVLTDRYAYSYWFEDKHNGAQMLFDHKIDPQENKNVVDDPKYKEVVENHRKMLDQLYKN